jgi:hypothetical protein
MPQNVFHRTGSGAVSPTRQSVALREWAEQRRIAYRTAARRAEYGELDEAGDADHPQSDALRKWAKQRRIAYRTVPGRAAVR